MRSGRGSSGKGSEPADPENSQQIQLQVPLLDPADPSQQVPRMGVRTAGIRKQTRRMPSHIFAPPPMAVNTPMGPTRPQVPMPEPAGIFSRPNTMVARGPGDHGDQCGRNPDPGIVHDVSHLEHAGAEPLGKEAAHLIFPPAHKGKADHLGTAACSGGASGQARQGTGRCR